jgi:hypothetical protein
MTCFDSGTLWDDFGVRSDVVVSVSFFLDINWFSKNLQPFTSFFPRADIHELLSPDLLHQLIKGTFKDHLVTWVNEYLVLEYGTVRGSEIIDDIDRRYGISFAFKFPLKH